MNLLLKTKDELSAKLTHYIGWIIKNDVSNPYKFVIEDRIWYINNRLKTFVQKQIK